MWDMGSMDWSACHCELWSASCFVPPVNFQGSAETFPGCCRSTDFVYLWGNLPTCIHTCTFTVLQHPHFCVYTRTYTQPHSNYNTSEKYYHSAPTHIQRKLKDSVKLLDDFKNGALASGVSNKEVTVLHGERFVPSWRDANKYILTPPYLDLYPHLNISKETKPSNLSHTCFVNHKYFTLNMSVLCYMYPGLRAM